MALQIYDQAYPYLNGALLTEATQVRFQLASDDQRVMTIAKGFAGLSPSPDVTLITVENAVPQEGLDIGQLEEYKLNRTLVTFGLGFGGSGQRKEVNGYITEVSGESGVGRATSFSMEFVGEPKKFQ